MKCSVHVHSPEAAMPSASVRFRVAGLVLLCFCLVLSGSFNAQGQLIGSDLVAHEWGTFTSIAGRNGQR